MVSINQIATRLMTVGIDETFFIEIMKYWEFRKGKEIIDLANCRKKAHKATRKAAKLEFEISMAEAYIADVLKKRRVKDA